MRHVFQGFYDYIDCAASSEQLWPVMTSGSLTEVSAPSAVGETFAMMHMSYIHMNVSIYRAVHGNKVIITIQDTVVADLCIWALPHRLIFK